MVFEKKNQLRHACSIILMYFTNVISPSGRHSSFWRPDVGFVSRVKVWFPHENWGDLLRRPHQSPVLWVFLVELARAVIERTVCS